MVMADFAGRDVILAQGEMALENFESARAKLDVAVLLCLVRSAFLRRLVELVLVVTHTDRGGRTRIIKAGEDRSPIHASTVCRRFANH